MKKAIISLLALTILGGLGWVVFDNYTEAETKQQRKREKPRVAVEVATIKKADIKDIGLFTGTLKPNSLFMVAPKVAGRLERILVNAGDYLNPNQVIAVLDDDEIQQQLRQAQATLEVAKANLEASKNNIETAKKELKRIQSLHKKKLIATSELDKAQTELAARNSAYQVAEAQLKEKAAALEVIHIRLSYSTIKNIWGEKNTKLVVGERFVNEGAVVGISTPIVSVLDITSMIGVIHVTEMDYFKIRPGQEAIVTVDALPNRKFKGTVVRISPIIKEESREAQIDLKIPNYDGILKPGLFIRTTIQFNTHRKATIIPIDALVKRDDIPGVFLLDENKQNVRFTKVKTGFIQDDLVEIRSPEISGSVITMGQHLLEDGSMVNIPDKIADKTKQKTDRKISK